MLKAITAFTVGHSVTLVLAALGIVHVPSALVECLVALSIVFVASELAHPDRSSFTKSRPWAIAFIFGLLHGLAFAGALAAVGLPQNAIPLSLFLFNLGVEIGQVFFVSVLILGFVMLRRITKVVPATIMNLALQAPAYIIGSFAAFWFLSRLSAVFI